MKLRKEGARSRAFGYDQAKYTTMCNVSEDNLVPDDGHRATARMTRTPRNVLHGLERSRQGIALALLRRRERNDARVLGFPCQDVSSENPRYKRSRTQVVQGSLRTGGVFRNGILAYMEAHDSVKCAIFENVMGLAVGIPSLGGSSPLDWVVTELASLGWQTFVIQLGPGDFGFAVSRPRLWMIVLPDPWFKGSCAVMSVEEAEALLKEYILGASKVGLARPVSIEKLRLSEDHIILGKFRSE